MNATFVSSAFHAANPLSNPLDFLETQNSLTPRRLDDVSALVVSKLSAGFDRSCVDTLTLLLRRIAEGKLTGLKYLVFDFAHQAAEGAAEAAEGFEDLASANAQLILDAPVISIAWARSYMADSDLDFALSCSMMVAERGARFSFDADPAASIGVYGSLAQKIGFVKTERLMESGEVLTADDLRDLFLVKEVVENVDGMAGIERYVKQCGRRYNASYGIFRAQRITMPPFVRQRSFDSVVGRRS